MVAWACVKPMQFKKQREANLVQLVWWDQAIQVFNHLRQLLAVRFAKHRFLRCTETGDALLQGGDFVVQVRAVPLLNHVVGSFLHWGTRCWGLRGLGFLVVFLCEWRRLALSWPHVPRRRIGAVVENASSV